MQLNVKTILNLKEKNPRFVYRDVRLTETKGQRIEVKVEPRRGSKGICSGCGKKCAGYDRLPQREFIHVPLWGIAVIFLYCMRRLACPTCGITAEVVPWSTGKSPLTIAEFFDWFGEERNANLRFVCSDMWKPFLNLIALRAKNALNILDRFHIAQKLSDAIDDVRAAETKELMRKGKEVVLKYSRWCFLKNPENLTENQKVKLKDLLKCNLKTIRAYLLKEDFQAFWDYLSPVWAAKFLDQWCAQVMRSRLEPMKKVAKTIRAHKQLILNWFEARNAISLGVVEGQNNKAKLVIRKSYGFKTSDMLKISLYHKLGKLPVPELAHEYF
jgi:transposase